MQNSELMQVREDPPLDGAAAERQFVRRGTRMRLHPIRSTACYKPGVWTPFVRRSPPYGVPRKRTNEEFCAITANVFFLKDIKASGLLESGDRKLRNIALPNEPKFFDDGRATAEKAFRLRSSCMSHHLRTKQLNRAVCGRSR